jgi:hypothetical protein
MGAKMAGMKTLPATPDQMTALPPACTSMAPTTPPINACDELDGMPRYQVVMFQAIPPASPAKTTARVTELWLTMPEAMVAATDSDKKAPTRLSTDDMATATRGFNAPVAMEVATALAES